MNDTSVVRKVSDLAARQWGLLTTAQAETKGISRLQLSRLTQAGVLERVLRGIYVMPVAEDQYTALRAAWLSLAPSTMAEDRLKDLPRAGVVSHTSAAGLYGIGDLQDFRPELTIPERKQSRQGIRFHRRTLLPTEVTIAHGLPTTTPPRTVADLLDDGHDTSHVAQIVEDVLLKGLATVPDLQAALDPVAESQGHPNGASLLDSLLEQVGLSQADLAKKLAATTLGNSLIQSGYTQAVQDLAAQLVPSNAMQAVAEAIKRVMDGTDFTNAISSLHAPNYDALSSDASSAWI